MTTQRMFDANIDRSHFDWNLCSFKRGFAQVDTGQDAWYFGTWANPATLRIVNYCEGDTTIQDADDGAEFAAELRKIRDWNLEQGHTFTGVDTFCNDELKAAFVALGLGDLIP